MNQYGFIDYKQPVGAQNDYRTSTYRGHVHLEEQIPLTSVGVLKNVCREYKPDGADLPRISEHQDHYHWKSTDPYLVRNHNVKNMKFIKSFEESHFRNGTKDMQPISSVFSQDYQWKSKGFEERIPNLSVLSTVDSTKNPLLNRSDKGYAKLLDPSATTSNLSYVAYTKEQLRVASKDNITFWNWLKLKNHVSRSKETVCDVFKSNSGPSRRSECNNSVKHVPNTGLTTQYRSTYAEPSNCTNFDITHIKNRLVSYSGPPMNAESENMKYGSKTRFYKYM